MPKNVHIIGFADDIALVVIAKHLEDIVMITNTKISQISDWLETTGLTLPESTTEAVLITGRKTREVATFCTKGVSITTPPAINYLEIVLDAIMSFKEHVNCTCEKAIKV